MTAGWPCTALRASLPNATPEASTDTHTKARAEIRSINNSSDSSRKSSQIFMPTVHAINSIHNSQHKNLLGGITRLTCTDVGMPCKSRKGIVNAASGRYRFPKTRIARSNQGAIQ